MNRLQTLIVALVTLPSLAWSAPPGAEVRTPQVRAELVAQAPEGVAPGKPLMLGLLIEHQPGWHTYWKNPGDSGLPTRLTWKLPEGVTAGPIEWPTPGKLPLGPLLNYGYDGRLLLPVSVQVPANFAAESLDVKLSAEWLVCKDVCIPEQGEFQIQIPARAATAAHAQLFADASAARPRPLASAEGTATVSATWLDLRVTGLPAEWRGRPVAFFPETPGVIQNAAEPQAHWEGPVWFARVLLDPQRSESPTSLPAVFTTSGETAGASLPLTVQGAWPAIGAASPLPAVQPGETLPPVDPAPPMGLPLAILFAVLGGMLLNLMPCVFPVLSLKVIGFARHSAQRGQLLAGGLAYTAGVVLSFVALAALMLALRAGGEQLGWGFQLQSPWVVSALAALFTLIGLNLAGLFEIGSLLPDRLATLQARHPMVDSALTGVLAVAVAAPCTAPLMGASLGLAVTLPEPQALTIFAALGLGMALPYLAASAWPALARALPRPGPWMVTFKGLMAFPMFATVVWLVWVLGQQVGIDGAAALLGMLVALAFVVWAVGAPGRSRRTRAILGPAGAILLALALSWAAPALRQDALAAAVPSTEAWQPWSSERVAEAVAAGRPVFVDFTAAWCVTCQYNKRSTLSKEEVMADFRARNVLLLRADWTRRDVAISNELSRLGRTGVPVYALFAPGTGQPRLLNEILSVAEVRDALAALP